MGHLDGNDRCLKCMGIEHTVAGFVGGSCSYCGKMTIADLRNRLHYIKQGGVLIPLPRTVMSASAGSVVSNFQITLRVYPAGILYTSDSQPAETLVKRAGPSNLGPFLCFSYPEDGSMSVAASKGV